MDPVDYHTVMFMSFTLTDAKTRYMNTDRECLSIIRALAECSWLVMGSKYLTKVYTDHEALLSILQKGNAKGRIAAWQYKLSEFDLEIVHIPGKKNVVVDGMSRITGGWDARKDGDNNEFS